ncbi:GNAT family N-acetyltransferase [Ramlibacter sp. USB13]|uniref:GNAT family N-acetyltransferase n=1 Tax=Ramlibacter cellulosilyticus TaxID=2764187 RepID=A0A923SAG3_9BURK|nr:GNAT family N-acetyltransferase [Ramlibacter cellulosilyticus]MBC5782756.1 GNAT family N-acetyltransferase [Ramlibacter cellulosilyticus]
MQIRRLAPADALSFRSLRLRALREHPDAFTSSWEEERELGVEAAAARLAGDTAFWGAFQGAELYGFVGLEREHRAKNRHKATVVAMFVAPEVAGQGVGRALLSALLAHARSAGLGSLVLTVTEGNERALNLYRAVGFRSFGIEPDAIRIEGRSHGKNHMHLDLGTAP